MVGDPFNLFSMKKLLWLDDIRNPVENKWKRWIKENVNYSGVLEIHWVKDYTQFVSWVLQHGLPFVVCFDHDIMLEHYMYRPEEEFKNIEWAENGYDCAKWMVDFCKKNNLPFPRYAVQSANPEGKEKIIGLIQNFKNDSQRNH